MGKTKQASALDPIIIDGILKEYGDRLFYQFPKGKKIKRNIRGGSFIKENDHSFKPCIRAKLTWTVGRIPEVVTKISGSGKNIRQIKEHLNYISRNAKIEVEDEQGNLSFGQQVLKEIVKSWERGRIGIPAKGQKRRESFNIVLSMPPGTDREVVKRAVRKFAQERFSNHQYAFASHDDEAHSHVHLVVKAVDRFNVRMNPRKADLQEWREHFAAKLREQGILANATPRRARGVIRRPEKQSIFHIERRGDASTAKSFRKKDIIREIKTGVTFQNPYQAPLLKARAETVKAYQEIANALSYSANINDKKLALDIAAFIQQMPPVKTVHQQAVEAFHNQYQGYQQQTPSPHLKIKQHLNPQQKKAYSSDYSKIDREQLIVQLSPRVEEIAEKYLGTPQSRTGKTWRYGSNQGSFSVTMKGQHQGYWYDFQTGEGGDILNLIEHAQKINSYPELLKEVDRFLGGINPSLQPRLNASKKASDDKAEEEANLRFRIEDARRIHRESQPLKGTMGETYLKKHRGIELNLDPNTFYFHPCLEHMLTKKSYPAVVITIRDENQAICGTQSIFLNPKTGVKISKEESCNARTISRGKVSIGQVVHQGKPNGQIALAEGVETALSVAMANPDWTVYATFSSGNFEKVALHSKAKSIMICADNDGEGSNTAKAVKKAAKNLSEKGIQVWVAEPKKPKGIDKWDFNNALLQEGVAQIRKDLANAKLYKNDELLKVSSKSINEKHTQTL